MADVQETRNYLTFGQMNLINTLRKIFMQLAMWRRAILVSDAANFEDFSIAVNRLYQVPTAIGNTLEIFLGPEIARRIEELFREQIIIGVEILQAEHAGNKEAIDELTSRMYQNADDIAAYLVQINPYWDEEKWRKLLYEYYRSTILEMVLVLAGEYQKAVDLYGNMENQALLIADYMAEGLIHYFMA